MKRLLSKQFHPFAAVIMLFALCFSCSEEPEVTEKPTPSVVNWNDSTINGDALMSMKFSVGWGGMTVGSDDIFTRTTTDIGGTVSFAEGDLIAIAVTRGVSPEVVKPYRVTSSGSLEYAGTDNEPFIWNSTAESITLRAWSYGSDANLSYLTTAPETITYNLETDQETNGYLELLYSKAATQSYSTSPITLSFYHQLSRIIINIDQELLGSLPTSTAIVGSSAFPLSATFTLPTALSNVGSWTIGDTYGTLTPKNELTQPNHEGTYSAVVFPGTYPLNTKLFTLSNRDGDYTYTISDNAGQTLTAGNQYAYTISVKNKLLFKNPLWWVAQYNLAEGGTSFVTEHSITDQYVFDFADATSGVNVPGYHVPTKAEQISIFAYDKTDISGGTNLLSIGTLDSPVEFSEQACNVGGTTVAAGTSVFGKNAVGDAYAVRFINTPYASAWHYKWVTAPCDGLLIESYLTDVADLVTAKTILAGLASSTIFTGSINAGTANQSPASITGTMNCFVQRFLPACGYKNSGSGTADDGISNGHYWSATETDSSRGWYWLFGSTGMNESIKDKTEGMPVRLFRNEYTHVKQTSGLTIGDITAYTYDGTAKEPTPDVWSGTTKLTLGTDYTLSYANNTNAGIATLTVTGLGNYLGTKTKTFTINKAASAVSTAPTAATGLGYSTYTGATQTLLSSGGTASGGTMMYMVKTTNSTPSVDDSGWTTTIPTALVADTYYVYYYVKGDNNHNNTSVSSPLTVNVIATRTYDVKMNPLWYMATYNMTAQTTMASAAGAGYYFTWATAMSYFAASTSAYSDYRTANKTITGESAKWHLPVIGEWYSIIPASPNDTPTYDNVMSYVSSENTASYKSAYITPKFGYNTTTKAGISESSYFRYVSNNEIHAIRFLGTNYCSAWKWKYSSGSVIIYATLIDVIANNEASAASWYNNHSWNGSGEHTITFGNNDSKYASQRSIALLGYKENGNSSSADTHVGTYDYAAYWSTTQGYKSGTTSGTGRIYLARNSEGDLSRLGIYWSGTSHGFNVRLFKDN